MLTYRLLLPLPLLLGWAALPSRAQNPADTLSAIRARTELSEDDRNEIRSFLSQRVAQVIGEDQALAREATKALRDAFNGSDAFKQAYAAACIEVFGSGYKKAELIAATRLVTVLGTFQAPAARNVFIDALQDPRVSVRAAAVLALRGLRPKLAQAGGEIYVGVLQALTEAGKNEKSRDTLRAIYGALDYAGLPTPPDLKPAGTALLGLLEHRAKPYAARQELTAAGADDAGLAAAEKVLKALNDDEKRRLTIVVATMMRFAIEEYTSPQKKLIEVRERDSRAMVAYRNGMERLVIVGEKLLAALLSPQPAPSVLDSMRKLDKAAIKLEWQKWVSLLQTKVNQDFTLAELPESAPEKPPGERPPEKE